MAEYKNSMKKPHSLMLECRSALTLTGINDIGSFDSLTVMLYTDYGGLCIKGSSLHISKLSLDTGEVTIDGQISAMIYTEASGKKSGVFQKLFK
ncbi:MULTISPECIES: sporulation protein YabP [unclassified Ruminococcus]|uniref:sporulation protein YabP n=1 Tax=unclassified Ruminococcus TaxID=2608920 RepID=UPI002108A4E5|nr:MULTISPECIES: sporulation protein YabP [unclassified Ruminococcus]MCQ4022274.1 sporulation protein YabP [Ruminococcus sp. zg-924]MCQ4114602.1 sporulation protein YabP [Ruminococcus sp. zg-921]